VSSELVVGATSVPVVAGSAGELGGVDVGDEIVTGRTGGTMGPVGLKGPIGG